MSSSTLKKRIGIAFAAGYVAFAAAVLVVASFAGGQRHIVLLVLSAGAFLQLGVFLAIEQARRRDAADRQRAADRMSQQLSFTAAITDNIGDGVFALDRQGRLTFMNPAASAMLGWTEEELLGKSMHEAIHFQRRDGSSLPALEWPLIGVLRTGESFHNAGDSFTRKDGTLISVDYVSSPFRVDGQVTGAVVAFQDIADRKKTEAELLERAHQAVFGAAVGAALTKAENLPAALVQCAEAMVHHLGAAMASIWTLAEAEQVLELQGSAWARRPLFGPQARVPVGEFRIGEIARDRRPALQDLTAGQEREDDKDWARREGMVAFAGYPLIVEDRLVGVMGMFATRPLTETALHALASVADEIALGIDRARAAEALRASEARTRAVVDHLMEGLIIVDEKAIIRADESRCGTDLRLPGRGSAGTSSRDPRPGLGGPRFFDLPAKGAAAGHRADHGMGGAAPERRGFPLRALAFRVSDAGRTPVRRQRAGRLREPRGRALEEGVRRDGQP